ncbi:hypothetical protein SUNI508_02824 [Seiridium unicorne]|uniref:Uncharacterized protein n=1 Tax=Seiridium unicorne TaxID=138068 RepID=A0ABR2VHG8_9PEZI
MHTITVWIERGNTIHKFSHTFTNSSMLISQLIYPADLFVLLQPFADQLGLDWDMDERELHLYLMRKRRPFIQNEEQYLPELLGGQLRLDRLSTDELRLTLIKMARREWNDIIVVRDVSQEKLGAENQLWQVMDGMSHLALAD